MAGGLPRLRTVSVEGPYNVKGISNTPSRERIFVCRPATAAEEPACAERIFTTLTRRAYRRPVTAADVEAPLSFYSRRGTSGGDFDAGIRAGVARVLASPSFLYRVERDPARLRAGAAHPISDIELASRLSFFLWSSIPDEQLLNAGHRRRGCAQPGVLEAQVRRMMADPRADALVSQLHRPVAAAAEPRVASVTPDLLLFPDFDDNIRKAFRKETELFFAHILRENRSALELLTRRLHVRERAAGQALRHSRASTARASGR